MAKGGRTAIREKDNDGVHVRDEGYWGLRVWFGSSRGMAKAHAHRDIEFNYVLQGQMNYLIGGRLVVVPAGRLTAIWGAMPHQNLMPASSQEENQIVWATFPLDGALLGNLPASFVQMFLGQGLVMETAGHAGDLAMFRQWASDLENADGRNVTQAHARAMRDLVQREMELRLHRLALDVTHGKPASRKRASGTRASRKEKHQADATLAPLAHHFEPVQTMAAYIAQHFDQPISTADVAAQVPLHPNYAMTLFARHTQMTISQYLTRQRIAHAQRLLATGSQSILEVGYASGFGSTSRFHEAFKQLAGMSPRAYRMQMNRG